MSKNNQSDPFYCAPNKPRIEKGIKEGKTKVLDLDKFRNKKTSLKTKAKLVFSPWIGPSKVFSSLTKLASEKLIYLTYKNKNTQSLNTT